MAETDTMNVDLTENGPAKGGLDFLEQLAELEKHLASLIHRKEIADRFSVLADHEISDLKEQISTLRQFIGFDEVNAIKPTEAIFDDLALTSLALHPRRGDVVRRGALSAKEKEKLAKEYEEEKEKSKEESQRSPTDKRQPQQPPKPGEKVEPEQPIKTPEERKDAIHEKLKQKDPRQQKEGLEELKKPENKDLGKDDPEFQKAIKESGKRVERFDKIRESLRKNLRELMQSDSEEVKKSIADLRAGKVGSGITKFKEIASSNDARFNPVAKAAKGVCDNVEALYKEFDIKPEEALSRATLNEAKPTFTRQTGMKSGYDIDIDNKSSSNKFMGEAKQLSRAELDEYAKIKERIANVYHVNVDKLPPADNAKREDANIVRSIVQEDALKPSGNAKVTPIIMAEAMAGKGSR